MLAALLMACLLSFHPAPGPAPVHPQAVAMTADDMASLHQRLMGKVDAMDRSRSGIFNEDVTALASPYFPVGQPMSETAAILRDQKLGELKPYAGKMRPDDGTMFAARFDLMSHVFAHVFVVLHFAYRRAPDGSLVLDHMRAYLRSQAM